MGEQKPEKTKKHICAGLLAHVAAGMPNHSGSCERIVRAISTRRAGSETNAAGKISPRISIFSALILPQNGQKIKSCKHFAPGAGNIAR